MQYSQIVESSKIRDLVLDSDSLDENLNCGICQELVIQPKECEECQHLFCETCIQDWMKKNTKCPYKCQSQVIKLKEPHRFVKNTISHIQIKCLNQDCPDITEIGMLDAHIKKCQYSRQPCPFEGCQQQIMGKDLQEHQQTCKFKQITCEKCDTKYRVSEQHDCIRNLRQILLQQAEIIKQLQELSIQSQKIEQDHTQQIKQLNQQVINLSKNNKNNKPQCEKGHILSWIQPKYNIQCSRCQMKNEIIRYYCDMCNKDFCQNCKKPVFNFQKCPIDHEMKYKEQAGQGISCDFCGQKPFFKNEPVWSDRDCDFDVCNTCFKKLSGSL